MIDRRTFLAGTGAVLLAAPLAVAAQQAGKVPRIGVLWPYSPAIATPFGDAFRQGLGTLGYVEGRHIALEERWADGKFDRLASLAAELIRLKVDVLVTASTPATQAAQQATKTTPIVMTLVSDPVDSGFVANLANPGGNVTGLSYMHPELSRKRLELIKDVIPKVSRVAVLSNPSNPSIRPLLRETEAAARVLSVQLQVVEARDSGQLDSVFVAMSKERARALVVMPDAVFQISADASSILRQRAGCQPCTHGERQWRPGASWPMGRAVATYCGGPRPTWTRSSRERSPPICPWRSPRSLSLSSTSRPPRPSA